MSIDHAQLLAMFLAEHDARCPSCGYNLRGTPSTTCPECGAAIVLSIQLAEKPTAPWLTAVFLHATAMVASGIYGFMIPVALLSSRSDDGVFVLLVLAPFGAGFIAAMAALSFLITWRHRIWTWRWPAQWLLVPSIAIVLMIVVVGMDIAMRFQ